MPDWLRALQPWWPDLAAFWRMGRHGAYVWPAFGLCALALALEWWALARHATRLRQMQSLAAQAAPPVAAGAPCHDSPCTAPVPQAAEAATTP